MGFLDFILGKRQLDPDRGNQPAPGTDNTLNTARTPQSDNSTDIKNFPVKNSELLTNLRFVDRSFNTLEEINAKLESAKKAFPLDAEKFETIKNQSHNLIINLNSYVEELLPNLRTGYSISAYETAQESLVKEPEVFKAARDKQLSIDNIEVSPDAAAAKREVSLLINDYIDVTAKVMESLPVVSFRSYPVGSLNDSVVMKKGTTNFAHDGTGLHFIQSREIKEVELRTTDQYQNKKTDRAMTLNYGVTNDGRHVIQQIGMRSCTASVTNMILLDKGKNPAIQMEYDRNLGTLEQIASDLKIRGVPATVYRMTDAAPIRAREALLESAIKESGSIILSVGGEIGGHVIILDGFNTETNTATIRDPYHGWSIKTTARAIANRSDGEYIAFPKNK
jgi:hypothetical protein